eukprot:scaffold159312_cov21-Tisochrysis_lutea.AAC.5
MALASRPSDALGFTRLDLGVGTQSAGPGLHDSIRVVARKELQLAHKYLHGPSGRAGPTPLHGHTWRLDKDEPTSTFNQMRGNL